jgi:NADP-dependent 3-hydroxy acid dehydrogenase YdfG
MGFNRNRGRLSAIADLLNKRAKAIAAGIDVNDRAAFRAWARAAQAEAYRSTPNPLAPTAR